MKRFLAVFLCLCMLLPATASFAASKASQQTYSTDSLKGEIVIDNPEFCMDDRRILENIDYEKGVLLQEVLWHKEDWKMKNNPRTDDG